MSVKTIPLEERWTLVQKDDGFPLSVRQKAALAIVLLCGYRRFYENFVQNLKDFFYYGTVNKVSLGTSDKRLQRKRRK